MPALLRCDIKCISQLLNRPEIRTALRRGSPSCVKEATAVRCTLKAVIASLAASSRLAAAISHLSRSASWSAKRPPPKMITATFRAPAPVRLRRCRTNRLGECPAARRWQVATPQSSLTSDVVGGMALQDRVTGAERVVCYPIKEISWSMLRSWSYLQTRHRRLR